MWHVHEERTRACGGVRLAYSVLESGSARHCHLCVRTAPLTQTAPGKHQAMTNELRTTPAPAHAGIQFHELIVR